MRRIQILPNIVTAFGLICGLFVIFKASMPGLDTYEVLHQAILILLLAAFADLIDGAIARAAHAESDFGVIFDSMADVISFGVAPSVLFLRSIVVDSNSIYAVISVGGALLYTLCGALRLVRFHVRTDRAKGNKEQELNLKKSFEGLPIPAAAAAVSAPALFLNTPLFEGLFKISQEQKCIVLAPIMVIVAYLMISRWRFPSAKTMQFRLPIFQLMLLAVIGAIVLLYGVLYFLSMLVLIFSWGYIISGITLSIIRKIAGRKSKKLVDFEPDPEDDQHHDEPYTNCKK